MRALSTLIVLLSALLAGCADAPAAPDDRSSTGPGEPSAPPPLTREDFQTFSLGPDEDIEWKLRMDEDALAGYSWSATRPVRFDFHGDRDDGTDDFVSHKKGTLASDAGSFRAPFEGRHGWYFHNANGQDVTIELSTEGDYAVVGRTGGSAP